LRLGFFSSQPLIMRFLLFIFLPRLQVHYSFADFQCGLEVVYLLQIFSFRTLAIFVQVANGFLS
jgi:hypothetical protein